jgi:hypothetical protein
MKAFPLDDLAHHFSLEFLMFKLQVHNLRGKQDLAIFGELCQLSMHELQSLVFFLEGRKVSEVLDLGFLLCSQLSNLLISLSNTSLSLLFQFG